MPSIPTDKFFPLFAVGLPVEIMIKILEETEGDPILKKEFLERITRAKSKEKSDRRLMGKSSPTTITIGPPEIDFDGYEDFNERVRIFKKRLAILLKPEYRDSD
ncbi:MAG: hypothetical protein ACFFDT_17335 [Candidatus Hodarchaeota archaeon]